MTLTDLTCRSILFSSNARCRNNGHKAKGCLKFVLYSSVFRREGAWLAWSTLCLHVAVARHKLIYLFDYCPASWQALVIDGHCVPAAARLLVSPAQNSLKDSSAGTPVTLLHFFCSSSLYHSLSLLPPHPLLSISGIISLLLNGPISPALPIFFFSFFIFFPSCWSADANWASDLCKFNLNNGGMSGVCLCALCTSAHAIMWRWKQQPPCVLPEPVPLWVTSSLSRLILLARWSTSCGSLLP